MLDAAHRGDPDALAQLLRLCQPDIRRYAQRNCLMGDVDDAVQEALLVLSRKLSSVRMLARVALNYDPWDDARAEEWLASQDTAALRQEVIRALESLPADYLQVLLLRDFAELSIGEIAAQLEQGSAAVKSRLHRARAMAREYLIA